jgi:hypothetical protein
MLANLDNFYKNSSSPDGINTYCKRCSVKKSHGWQKEHRNEYNAYARERDKDPEIRNQKRQSNKERLENGKYLEWQRSESGKKSVKKSNQKWKQHKVHDITDEQ